MNNTVLLTLIVAAGVILGWMGIWALFSTARAKQKVWRAIKCLFGKHAPGPVKAEVGGRNVQRCLYCDQITYEYEVTKSSITRRM